jgi:hypothetical protein
MRRWTSSVDKPDGDVLSFVKTSSTGLVKISGLSAIKSTTLESLQNHNLPSSY